MATCELNLGLHLQYHFVGLDKHANNADTAVEPTVLTEPPQSPAEPTMSQPCNDEQTVATDPPTCELDDATIAEGDEHTRQIIGSPLASMMSVENPEAFMDIVSIAPAKGQRPLSIMSDTNFEAMSNPDKFPCGTECFSADRPRKLTYRKYFNQRLLDVDGRFARDIDYLFAAQYIVEAKQISDDWSNFKNLTGHCSHCTRAYTA